MPLGDKTGPEGKGPLTGRGAGECPDILAQAFSELVKPGAKKKKATKAEKDAVLAELEIKIGGPSKFKYVIGASEATIANEVLDAVAAANKADLEKMILRKRAELELLEE